MPTETGRHRLYETVKEAWGEDNATELMSYLPPVGWADVATKHDVQALGTELRSEMTTLRAELRLEMAELSGSLRSEMAELSGSLRGEMAELSGSLHGEMAELSGSVRGEMAGLRLDIERGFNHQLRSIIGAMVGLTAIFGTIATIVALFG
jgi:hypothetical protein